MPVPSVPGPLSFGGRRNCLFSQMKIYTEIKNTSSVWTWETITWTQHHSCKLHLQQKPGGGRPIPPPRPDIKGSQPCFFICSLNNISLWSWTPWTHVGEAREGRRCPGWCRTTCWGCVVEMPSRVRKTPFDGGLGMKTTVKVGGFRSDGRSFRESCKSLSWQGGMVAGRKRGVRRLIERDQTEVPWEWTWTHYSIFQIS